MIDYNNMFEYIKNIFDNGDKYRKSTVFFDKYAHTKRVLSWAVRIANEIGESLDIDSLRVATIFHDVGYSITKSKEEHADNSEIICREYLLKKGYPIEKVDFIRYLIANHSNKEMLNDTSIPLELVILLEADLLDCTGAQGIILDTWMEVVNNNNPDFEGIYNHIERYTLRDMNNNPMKTEPARAYWENKQKLTNEFIKQYAIDIGIIDI